MRKVRTLRVLEKLKTFNWHLWGMMFVALLAVSALGVGCQRLNRWVADGVAQDEKLAPSQDWSVVSVLYRSGANEVRCAEVILHAHDEHGRYITSRGVVVTPEAPDYGVITQLHLGQKVRLQHSPKVIIGHTAEEHLLVLPPGSK